MEKDYYEVLKQSCDGVVKQKIDMALYQKKNRLQSSSMKYENRLFECETIVYALYLIQNDISVNPRSMETFLATTALSKDLREIVERYTTENWDIVVKFVDVFTQEQLLAAILFDTFYHDSWGRSPLAPTPAGVINLVCKILDIKDGETVLNLCSGLGNFLVEAYGHNQTANYTAVELNSNANDILKIKSNILGNVYDIVVADALEHRETVKVDKIFSHYPWGLKLPNSEKYKEAIKQFYNMPAEINRLVSAEWLFNIAIVEQLNDTGKAVAFAPTNIITSTKDMKIRKLFVKKGYIESVIMLPDQLVTGTGIGSSLIVFSNNNNSIRLIDARHCLGHSAKKLVKNNVITEENVEQILLMLKNDSKNSIVVTDNDLEKENYNLDPVRYLVTLPKVENAKPLKDVCFAISRGAQLRSAKVSEEHQTKEVTPYRYLMLPNIVDGVINYDDRAVFLNDVPERVSRYSVPNHSLVISRVSAGANDFKTAVVKVAENEIVVADGNLIVLELDESKIDPYFLQAFFASEIGVATLKRAATGEPTKMLSLNDLEKALVPVPPLEIQKKIGKKFAAELDEIAILKRKLEQAKERIKLVYNQEE